MIDFVTFLEQSHVLFPAVGPNAEYGKMRLTIPISGRGGQLGFGPIIGDQIRPVYEQDTAALIASSRDAAVVFQTNGFAKWPLGVIVELARSRAEEVGL